MLMENSLKTALVFGPTGLVGSFVVDELLSHPAYGRVVIFARNSSGKVHEKLEEHVVDLRKIEEYSSLIKGDHVYSCYGTNITQTRDKEQWKFSDVDLVLQTARIAKDNGAVALAVVSSIGANAKAGSFYLRLKGEMEEGLKALNYAKLALVRPSFLLGRRKKVRWHEEPARWAMQFFGLFMWGKAAAFKAIHARTVARAMIEILTTDTGDQVIFSSGQLRKLGK
jgi:uncharacterized protein YbjT (DUF2867 family)